MLRNILYLTLVIGALAFLAACGSSGTKKQKQPTESVPPVSKPPSSYIDTFSISEKAAVFYYPDSLQLEKLRAILDTSVFGAIMHEYEYLEKNARSVLKKYLPSLPVYEAKNVRYLNFRGAGSDSCVNLDLRGDPVGLYFFAPNKFPHPVDMANIDSELSLYFSGL